MPSSFPPFKPRRGWLLLLAALGAAFLLAWQFKLPGLAWYWFGMRGHAEEWAQKGVWLPGYRVGIDGRRIEGIGKNASGLTFNPETRTLFTVINAPPQVAEITTDGRLLRTIPLTGVGDPEGISHVDAERYVIADERDQQLYWVEIGPDTGRLDVSGAPRLGLAIDLGKNLGFEGVSWDHAKDRLFVAKEKSPLRVLEISGIPALFTGGPLDLQIREWKPSRARTLFMTDLSSLTLHEPTGNLLLLSHESRLVVEYAYDGTPVSILPLWKGWHGLARTVPQAEGLAIDDEGTLYVLSEPDLFYRFERTAPPAWRAAAP